jgi:hypothetical protein
MVTNHDLHTYKIKFPLSILFLFRLPYTLASTRLPDEQWKSSFGNIFDFVSVVVVGGKPTKKTLTSVVENSK